MHITSGSCVPISKLVSASQAFVLLFLCILLSACGRGLKGSGADVQTKASVYCPTVESQAVQVLVSDEGGNPVSNARVSVFMVSGSTQGEYIAASSSSTYIISDYLDGVGHLKVEAAGFKTLTRENVKFVLNQCGNITVYFELKLEAELKPQE